MQDGTVPISRLSASSKTSKSFKVDSNSGNVPNRPLLGSRIDLRQQPQHDVKATTSASYSNRDNHRSTNSRDDAQGAARRLHTADAVPAVDTRIVNQPVTTIYPLLAECTLVQFYQRLNHERLSRCASKLSVKLQIGRVGEAVSIKPRCLEARKPARDGPHQRVVS